MQRSKILAKKKRGKQVTRLIMSLCSLAALMIVAYGFFTLSDNSWAGGYPSPNTQTSVQQPQGSEIGHKAPFSKPRVP